jgi:hypothetical protein
MFCTTTCADVDWCDVARVTINNAPRLRFSLAHNVRWYIKTCHDFRQTAAPASLFRKAHTDTMPHASGYWYTVQARCSLSAWPEWRALRTETGRTPGAFFFEEVLSMGSVEEIVTDNGTAFVAALQLVPTTLRHPTHMNLIPQPATLPYAFWAGRLGATTRKSTTPHSTWRTA